jgi:hypothetical protein
LGAEIIGKGIFASESWVLIHVVVL